MLRSRPARPRRRTSPGCSARRLRSARRHRSPRCRRRQVSPSRRPVSRCKSTHRRRRPPRPGRALEPCPARHPLVLCRGPPHPAAQGRARCPAAQGRAWCPVARCPAAQGWVRCPVALFLMGGWPEPLRGVRHQEGPRVPQGTPASRAGPILPVRRRQPRPGDGHRGRRRLAVHQQAPVRQSPRAARSLRWCGSSPGRS
jgi:hypothetical protein